ncbi:ATP-dependent endonuclease [Streptomyces sp. NPDC127033]|uniref:ATP-dependent nuclease n=1 Tax=Streptomyces sp. NPDC127033 TaxID=3347110 RepID=UPI00365ECECF
MRLRRLSLSNFRGVREFSATDLDSFPITVLTGPNASGKSSILEALAFLGMAAKLGADTIGPNGPDAQLEASFALDDRELELLDGACREKFGRPAARRSEFTRSITLHSDDRWEVSGSEEMKVAFSPEFRAAHQFTEITLIDPTQSFKLKNNPTIGLGIPFDPKATIKSHAGFNHPAMDTEGYLASLDYQSMLANREGREGDDGFAEISATFQQVTGQILLRPSSNQTAGSSHISVALPTGHHHGLSGLSSGHLGALGLLCLGYYLKTTGGIALIDEPEVHLHPSVQVPLINAFRDFAAPAQTLIVTHSPHIVSNLPARCIIEVRPSSNEGNQAHRPVGPYGASDAVGQDAADDMLKEFQLVVEGKCDEGDLFLLFPSEMSRAKLVKAGSSSEVMAHYKSLTASENRLPWLCLRDRDLMTASEVQHLSSAYPNLHVWPRRAIESMLLHPPLISATFATVGHRLTEKEVEELLRELAEPLMKEVAKALTHVEINQLHPQPKPGSFNSTPDFYFASARVDDDRAKAWDTVLASQQELVKDRWNEDFLDLVEPKSLLGALQSRTRIFNKAPILRQALLSRAGQDENVRPPGLEDFRLKMTQL